ADGKTGVDIALDQKPDLILMDIQLPVMNGIEATRLIKSHQATCHIPILALTGYAMEDDMKQIQNAGCNGYISKPFHIRDILNTVKDCLLKQENAHEQNAGHPDC
ncbi:MAG: response regulator, partial [Desulfatirhabdiaceae bacterium]